jgi:PAS domain S-box-containing protein
MDNLPTGSIASQALDMRSVVARHDWAATPLGPIDSWPTGLRAIVGLMMDSAEAMVVWWGPQQRQIYNDAYAPRLPPGQAHLALGRPAAADWAHSWPAIYPLVQLVLAGQPSTGYTDTRIGVERNGSVEDSYWSYSFTPVRDDLGAIGGVLVMSVETTARVLANRRQHSLDVLRGRLAGADSEQALARAAQAVALDNPDDLCGVVLTSTATGTASDADADVDADADAPLQLSISAKQVGVDVDLAVVFQRSATLPFDSAYRLFLEQFTILVAAARHRIDSETRRLIVEAERDRLLLDAPVGAAVMIGRSFVEVFPELRGAPVHENFQQIYRSGEAFISEPTLVTIHRHGGELEDRYFTYNLSPLRTLAGQVYGLMVIAVDITTQVRARRGGAPESRSAGLGQRQG